MFKDYYSILGISYPSSDDTIRQSHQSKVEELGAESSKPSDPNYQQRVDIEEAFRVLSSSYGLKEAYDEEYSKYLETEDKLTFCVQDIWTKSKIESEHEYVVNRLLQPIPRPISSQEKKKGCGGITLGCLWKILGFILMIIVITAIKTCSKNQMKNALSDSSDYTEKVPKQLPYSTNSNSNFQLNTTSQAEQKLEKMAGDINQSLPRIIDDNITMHAIRIASYALVYEYKVDDDYFDMYKNEVLSNSLQLERVKEMYSDMQPMIDLLIETHRGISYKYICKRSGEINTVDISYEQLAGL